jgi:hypothetical protein
MIPRTADWPSVVLSAKAIRYIMHMRGMRCQSIFRRSFAATFGSSGLSESNFAATSTSLMHIIRPACLVVDFSLTESIPIEADIYSQPVGDGWGGV